MGDIRNGIDFVYRWLLKGTNLKEFGTFFAIVIGFALCIVLGIFFGLVGVVLAIFIGIVLLICAVGYFYTYQGIALREAGYSARIYEFSFGEAIKWVGRIIGVTFTAFFNWVEPKILAVQIFGYILLFISSLVYPLSGIAAAIVGVAAVYSGSRFVLSLPIRNVEKDEVGEAIRTSWAYSKGRFWELMALGSVLAYPLLGMLALSTVVALMFIFTIGYFVPIIGIALAVLVGIFVASASLMVSARQGVFIYHIIKQTETGKYFRLR